MVSLVKIINEITGEKRTFFNLGPNNNWEKMLKKENIDKD